MPREPNLDNWRIKRLPDSEFAFGPVHLRPRWRESDAAFITALAATPKHGMLWSDAEAQGFMQAQVSKEASAICARINRAWRAVVCERAGRTLNNIGGLVRSCTQHGKGTPMCIVINDGLAWMEAWRAAVWGGVTKAEVDRLRSITGVRFTKAQLALPAGFRTHHEYRNDIGFKWDDFRKDHPMFRAIMALSLINGDSPCEWGDITLSFHWGWLQDSKHMAEQIEAYLGESALARFGYVRKTTTTWERADCPSTAGVLPPGDEA